MSRQHHYLKTETEYFQAVERGEKKFELRINDRGFRKYDIVYLQEVVIGTPTGRELPGLAIQYILEGPAFGLLDGWCILNW